MRFMVANVAVQRIILASPTTFHPIRDHACLSCQSMQVTHEICWFSKNREECHCSYEFKDDTGGLDEKRASNRAPNSSEKVHYQGSFGKHTKLTESIVKHTNQQ
jgi:hypothetical protein